MHLVKEKLTGRRKMKYLLIAMTSLVLSVAPVSAQDIPPTLSPAAAQTIIQQTTGAVDRYGAINVALFVFLIFVLFVVGVFIWKAIVPLIQSNTAANQQIAVMTSAAMTMQTQASSAQASSAQQAAQERAVHTSALQTLTVSYTQLQAKLDEVEKTQDAKTGRTSVVGLINEHTTAASRNLGTKMDNEIEILTAVKDDVASLAKTVKEAPTRAQIKADISDGFDSIDERLSELIQQILTAKKTGQTDKLNPASVPVTDPAHPNEH